MDLISWLPALTTSGLLACGVWLARQAISARLTRSVQHEFDGKLATIRSELTASEERLKSTLREREAEISALRSGALSSLASRQAATDKRRLEAIDQLWSAFTSHAVAKSIAVFMSTVKFEEAAEECRKNPKARQVFGVIGDGFNKSDIDTQSANKSRPFVSPMAWAVYSAYSAVTMHSVMQWQMLKSGLGALDLADHKAIKCLITTALPHLGDYLDNVGSIGYYHALEMLEQKLMAELQSMISGNEHDRAALEQAARIIEQSNKLQESTRRSNHP